MDQANNQKPNCLLCEVPKDSIEALKKNGSEANSKKGEYDQKKREEEKKYSQKKSFRKTRNALLVALPILLVVAGLSFALVNGFSGRETGSTGTPVMEVNPKEYDTGTISMAAGKIKYSYEIQNKGDGDLKISNIKTSCHCTTARLIIRDAKSPEFGMESAFSSWSGKIQKGETGYLEVTFDPAFHGSSGLGDAVRATYFSTNDPKNKNVQVVLSANVAP